MALDDTGSWPETPGLRQQDPEAAFRSHSQMFSFNPELSGWLALEPLGYGRQWRLLFDYDSCAEDFLVRLLGVAPVREKEGLGAAY
jgi:hypothetical protein